MAYKQAIFYEQVSSWFFLSYFEKKDYFSFLKLLNYLYASLCS